MLHAGPRVGIFADAHRRLCLRSSLSLRHRPSKIVSTVISRYHRFGPHSVSRHYYHRFNPFHLGRIVDSIVQTDHLFAARYNNNNGGSKARYRSERDDREEWGGDRWRIVVNGLIETRREREREKDKERERGMCYSYKGVLEWREGCTRCRSLLSKPVFQDDAVV